MKYTKLLLVLSVLLFFYACKKDEIDDPTKEQQEETFENSVTPEDEENEENGNQQQPILTMEEKILEMVNSLRESGCNCGSTTYPPVPELSLNDNLIQAAKIHSDDMHDNDFFSHQGSDGSSVGTRVQSAGYSWKSVGENIAFGQSTAQQVMNAWLNSAGHCANIMNASRDEMGIARKGNYWTQVFAKD